MPPMEPLCGEDWVKKHQHDLDDWVPKMEIIRPGSRLTFYIKNKKTEKEIIEVLREGRK